MIDAWQARAFCDDNLAGLSSCHSDGLPCRSIGTTASGAAMQWRAGGPDGDHNEKVDSFTLALLYLTTFKDKLQRADLVRSLT